MSTSTLETKLQLRAGQSIAMLGENVAIDLATRQADARAADAILVFVVNEAQLRQYLDVLHDGAANGKLAWVAYPKAQQLDTDVNRDIVRRIANENELDPVRQIAINETWSALRLKPYVS